MDQFQFVSLGENCNAWDDPTLDNLDLLQKTTWRFDEPNRVIVELNERFARLVKRKRVRLNKPAT
jgi:hypothetical protein